MKFEVTYRLYEDIVLSEFITIAGGNNMLEQAYNEAYKRSMEIKTYLGLTKAIGQTCRVTSVRQITMAPP